MIHNEDDVKLLCRAEKTYQRWCRMMGVYPDEIVANCEKIEWGVNKKGESIAVITLANHEEIVARYSYKLATDRMRMLDEDKTWGRFCKLWQRTKEIDGTNKMV